MQNTRVYLSKQIFMQHNPVIRPENEIKRRKTVKGWFFFVEIKFNLDRLSGL